MGATWSLPSPVASSCTIELTVVYSRWMSEMDASADAHKSESGVTHHLKIVVRGNKIELDFDNGDVNLTYIDSIGFTHGSVGLYTDGAASIYLNLKIYY